MRKARLNDFLGEYRDPSLSRAAVAESVAKCIRGCNYFEDTVDLCGIIEEDLTLEQKIAEVSGLVDRVISWSAYAAMEHNNKETYAGSEVSRDLHELGHALIAQLLKHVDEENDSQKKAKEDRRLFGKAMMRIKSEFSIMSLETGEYLIYENKYYSETRRWVEDIYMRQDEFEFPHFVRRILPHLGNLDYTEFVEENK